jgi:hypothetical protein
MKISVNLKQPEKQNYGIAIDLSGSRADNSSVQPLKHISRNKTAEVGSVPPVDDVDASNITLKSAELS